MRCGANPRRTRRKPLCARDSNGRSCTVHPRGRHHARGQDAPESGRFKGLWGFQRGLRGESELPCPLWPSPGRRPARRRLVLTQFVIIAFLSEGERTSGGAREGGGLSISPFALSGLSRIPLKRFFAGDFQSPCQKGHPLGERGAASDVLIPCTLRLLPRVLRVSLIAAFSHAPLRDRATVIISPPSTNPNLLVKRLHPST